MNGTARHYVISGTDWSAKEYCIIYYLSFRCFHYSFVFSFCWVSLMRSCVAKVLLSQAHSRSLSFAVWTVNNETDMLHVCIYFSYLSLFLSSSLLFPLYSHIYFAIGCESRSRRDHRWVSTKLKKAYHFQIQQPRNEEHFIGIKSIHDSCDFSINLDFLDSLDFLDFLDSLDSLDFLDFKFWFLETPSHHLILKIEHIACACCGDRRCMYQSETLQLMYQQLLTKVRTHPSSSSLYHLSPSFSILIPHTHSHYAS